MIGDSGLRIRRDELEPGIVQLTLDAPGARNAIDDAMAAQLVEEVGRLGADEKGSRTFRAEFGVKPIFPLSTALLRGAERRGVGCRLAARLAESRRSQGVLSTQSGQSLHGGWLDDGAPSPMGRLRVIDRTSSASLKRRADQSSSTATWDTGTKPRLNIGCQPLSRLMSVRIRPARFGYSIHSRSPRAYAAATSLACEAIAAELPTAHTIPLDEARPGAAVV